MAAAADEVDEGAAYELARQRNIAQNAAMLASLGLATPARPPSSYSSSSSPSLRRPRSTTTTTEAGAGEGKARVRRAPLPERRSVRVAGLHAAAASAEQAQRVREAFVRTRVGRAVRRAMARGEDVDPKMVAAAEARAAAAAAAAMDRTEGSDDDDDEGEEGDEERGAAVHAGRRRLADEDRAWALAQARTTGMAGPAPPLTTSQASSSSVSVSVSVPVPASASASTKVLAADVDRLLREWLGRDIPPRGGQVKAAVMQLAVEARIVPRYNKYSGLVPWANAFFLCVNVGGDQYANVFLHNGTQMTWFAPVRPTQPIPLAPPCA
jgi:hypothetical protein